ncbi:unnamed protein product [Sphagnum tenellum]
MEMITTSIPWRPDEHEGLIRVGDWLANTSPRASNPLEWVYLVLEPIGEAAAVLEFQRITHEGRIKVTTNQATRILTTKLRPVRVLSQERPEATLNITREPPAQGKAPLLYWIFDEGFIRDLPWDPGEWHWQAISPLGNAPFYEPPSRVLATTNRSSLTMQGVRLQLRGICSTPSPQLSHGAQRLGSFQKSLDGMASAARAGDHLALRPARRNGDGTRG